VEGSGGGSSRSCTVAAGGGRGGDEGVGVVSYVCCREVGNVLGGEAGLGVGEADGDLDIQQGND
jgi:hypothetical protein